MSVESKTTADVRETFKDFLTSKGLRVTNQRLAIFDAAYESIPTILRRRICWNAHVRSTIRCRVRRSIARYLS